jgi:hypothetical protein
MKIRLFCVFLMSAFIHLSLGAPQLVVPDPSKTGKDGGNNFNLVANSSAADLLIDSNDSKTVLLATRLFSEDIESVSGQKAQVKKDVKSVSPLCVIVGTIDQSRFIKELIQNKTIDVGEVKGKWESCRLCLVSTEQKWVQRIE